VFRLYFISDRRLTPSEPPERPLVEALDAGVDMVQVREKDLDAAEVLRIARAVSAHAAGTASEVYVNSRFDIAAAAGADGVHLPASGLGAGEVRRAAPAGIKIGVSTHSAEEVRAAAGAGADFVTFGPVFDTPSKRIYGPPVGLAALKEAAGSSGIPVYAIGGIHSGNLEQVLDLPVAGVAVISAIARAADRRAAVEALREAGRRSRGE